MLGPPAGAAVLAVADWRAIFWLNLLLGLGLAAAVGSARPASRRRRLRPRGRGNLAWPSWLRPRRWPRTSPSACSTSCWCPRSRPRPAGRGGGAGGPPARGAQPDPAGGDRAARGGPPAVDEGRRAGLGPGGSWRSAAWCGPSRQPIRRPSSWRTARGCCPSHWSPGWPSSCTSAGRPIRCCPCARPSVGAWGALLVNLAGGCGTGGCAGRRPPVRPGHDDAGRPTRCGLRAAPAARRRAGGGGGRWLALPVGGAEDRRGRRDGSGSDGLRGHDQLGRRVAGRRRRDGGAPGQPARVRARDRAGQRRRWPHRTDARQRQALAVVARTGSGCSSGCPR